MSRMHQIDGACDALTLLTEEFSGKLHSKLYGPIVVLTETARAGGFIHSDTDDTRQLIQSAATLRALANEIDAAREALEANEVHSYHLEAAE